MHHPLLGALFPLLIAAALYGRRHRKASLRMLILTPLAMATGAIWAVIPDIPRLIGAHDLYMRLARDPRTDLFFWHYSIDQIEHLHLEPMAPFFNILFAVMMALPLIAAWHELRRLESQPRHSEPEG